MSRSWRHQRGAAVLTAMLVVTLTVFSGCATRGGEKVMIPGPIEGTTRKVCQLTGDIDRD